jgi:hypothetical protein
MLAETSMEMSLMGNILAIQCPVGILLRKAR